MSTSVTTTRSSATAPTTTPTKPRVWLVAGGHQPEPLDLPPVRDGLQHLWEPGADGLMHTRDGWHHATWHELRVRFDLVEVGYAHA